MTTTHPLLLRGPLDDSPGIIGRELSQASYRHCGTLKQEMSEQLGLTLTLWDMDGFDYVIADPRQLVYSVDSLMEPSLIVLLHSNRDAAVKALPIILEKLKPDGFKLCLAEETFDRRW